MEIEPGQTLLHYRLTEPIGEGGMGVVWKALDTALDREVAIKILPPGLDRDPERLERFEREAKLLASLNHPNIAAVYGLHEADGTRFLAMEYVPGEDLAATLKRGPLSTERVLDVARQIADALEAAHERGVIHRDLKPANVLLTAGGQAKVLDFGLAKALDGPGGAGAASGDPSASPTVTSLGTVAGVILGTAAYMSPEQARGHDVDRRTDVWSFGALLYELLSGDRPFAGDTISDTLAAVLRADPDPDRLRPDTPPLVRRVVRRCLIKDPRRRTQSIAEVRARLEDAIADPDDLESGILALPPDGDDGDDGGGAGRKRRTNLLPWAIAAIALLLAVGSFALWQRAAGEARPPLRSAIGFDPPANPSGGGWNIALLSGGQRILYAGGEGDERRLWLRDLSKVASDPVSGTERGDIAAVSPDEQWIAFFSDGELKKVSVNGGEPIVLARGTQSPRGGSWSDDGWIYYAPGTRDEIRRVPEDGGEPETVTEMPREANSTINSHRWPQILPGDRALLYLAGTGGDFSESRIEVRDLETGEVRVLQTGGYFPRYFDGHLGFVRDGVLHVAGFDPKTLTITSPPVPTVRDVHNAVGNGGAQYDVSDDGTLLYIPGRGTNTADFEMKWLDAAGPSTTLVGPDALFHPRFSPDGKRVAYTRGLGSGSDIHVYDVERGQSTRLTLDAHAADRSATWSPDGKSIAFSSDRDGPGNNVYRRPVDGSGAAVALTTGGEDYYPTAWSSDGRMLLLMKSTRDRDIDIALLRLGEDGLAAGEPETLVSSPRHDMHAVFSPDDRYIAYVSEEAGIVRLYVRSLEGSARWQISDRAGWGPRWLPNGRLYYHAWEGVGWQGNGVIRRVAFAFDAGGVPVPGQPEDVVALPLDVVQAISAMFDVRAGDERLLVLSPTAQGQFGGVVDPVVLQGWVGGLGR